VTSEREILIAAGSLVRHAVKVQETITGDQITKETVVARVALVGWGWRWW
jgi:hypothetical protein